MECHPDPLKVAAYSTCPSGLWHARIAPMIAEPEMIMLNVGANKGYNLVEFVQRYTSSASNLTHAAWYARLMAYGCQAQCCGVCASCRATRIPQQASAKVHLHAFELQPANAQLLRRMVAAADLPVTVHSTAVSNSSGGVVYTSNDIKPGSESFGIVRRHHSTQHVARPVTTVDAFMQEQRIARAHLVSIDTEGARSVPCGMLHLVPFLRIRHVHRISALPPPDMGKPEQHPLLCMTASRAGEDPLVLFGMARVLTERRVEVVEFEYNRKWKAVLRSARPMAPVIEWMRERGYYCFWQGNKGALAQLSGTCYREETRNRFGFARSNAVCTHRPDVIAALRTCQRRPYCSDATSTTTST